MATDPIIRADNVSKTFQVIKRRPGFLGGLKTLFSADFQEVRAVDGISFEIGRGELVGYLGPNGAGKSTTIKMLTGVLRPSDGEIVVNGLVPYEERGRNAKNIGVVFGQREQLNWDLPPRDTYQLMRRMYSIPSDKFDNNLAMSPSSWSCRTSSTSLFGSSPWARRCGVRSWSRCFTIRK